MDDYFLKGVNEAEVDDAMIAAGLAVEVEDEEGLVTLIGAEGVCLDVIGEIPEYTGWHVNLRVLYDLNEEQLACIDSVRIQAPAQPYRVFA